MEKLLRISDMKEFITLGNKMMKELFSNAVKDYKPPKPKKYTHYIIFGCNPDGRKDYGI